MGVRRYFTVRPGLLLIFGVMNSATFAEAGKPLTGWTQVSYTLSSSRNSTQPVSNNDLPDKILLQQNWITFEHQPRSDPDRTTAGFKTSLVLPGTDHRFTGSQGLLDKQNRLLGVDPFEFHLDLRVPRGKRHVDLELGRFVTGLGAEYIDAPRNTLITHSLVYNATPSSHTGLLAFGPLSDQFSASLGLVAGSDIFIDPAARATAIGSLSYVPPGTQDSLSLFFVYGPGHHVIEGDFDHARMYDIVYSRKLSTELTLTVEAVIGTQRGVPDPFVPELVEEEVEDAAPLELEEPDLLEEEWKGLVLYLSRTLTPELTGTVRYELFDDDKGLRFGFPGLYENLSACLGFTRGRWMVRGELRYDEHLDGAPFEGKSHQTMASFDVVRTW